MLRFNFRDNPGKPDSAERGEHPGTICGCQEKLLPHADTPDGYLHLSVFTNGTRNRGYSAWISSIEFENLAKEMLKANREVAIRAFGAAFQAVTFPSKPQEDARVGQANPQAASAATNGILSLVPSRASGFKDVIGKGSDSRPST